MDVQQIKFNQELIQNKIKLEKELKITKQEIKESQKKCDHILVRAGYYSPSLYQDTKVTECLFCRTEVMSAHNYPIIEATTYKRMIYGDGESNDDRNERIKCLQALWIKNMTDNKDATTEELVSKMREAIEEDEKKNKTMEKSLIRRFI